MTAPKALLLFFLVLSALMLIALLPVLVFGMWGLYNSMIECLTTGSTC